VLRLLASDLPLHEIARELFVSYNTIKTQTQSIYRKLLVSNRAEAVARSRDDGLI
jgi:LuxR family maltose regulon positive regulatory protein